MRKTLYGFLFVVLFLSGCSSKDALSPVNEEKQSSKKMFEEEDTLILFALRSEQVGDFESAVEIFDELYDRSRRLEYIYRSLQNRLYLKKYTSVITSVDGIMHEHSDDITLMRLKVVALIQLNKLDEAFALMLQVLQKEESEKDYILLSEILILQQKFESAVTYLDAYYMQNYNEVVLDKISVILYAHLQKKNEAIEKLEMHVKAHGASEITSKRLIAIYSKERNVDGMLSAYLKYYKVNKSEQIADKLVQLYGYKKDYINLMLFLQESGSNDKVLLELYITAKNFEKASPLAQKLYDKTGKVKYFGESVIYEYESQKNKNDKVFLDKISDRFEVLLSLDKSSLYLNYYGYILIDHNVNIDKGIGYVQEALKLEPNSFFYLDSLAWGYYKKGECAKSLKMIKEVMKLESEDKEVLKHYRLIKKCKGKK